MLHRLTNNDLLASDNPEIVRERQNGFKVEEAKEAQIDLFKTPGVTIILRGQVYIELDAKDAPKTREALIDQIATRYQTREQAEADLAFIERSIAATVRSPLCHRVNSALQKEKDEAMTAGSIKMNIYLPAKIVAVKEEDFTITRAGRVVAHVTGEAHTMFQPGIAGRHLRLKTMQVTDNPVMFRFLLNESAPVLRAGEHGVRAGEALNDYNHDPDRIARHQRQEARVAKRFSAFEAFRSFQNNSGKILGLMFLAGLSCFALPPALGVYVIFSIVVLSAVIYQMTARPASAPLLQPLPPPLPAPRPAGMSQGDIAHELAVPRSALEHAAESQLAATGSAEATGLAMGVLPKLADAPPSPRNKVDVLLEDMSAAPARGYSCT